MSSQSYCEVHVAFANSSGGGGTDDETTPLLGTANDTSRRGQHPQPQTHSTVSAATHPYTQKVVAAPDPDTAEQLWGARRNLQISVFLGFGLVLIFLRVLAGGA